MSEKRFVSENLPAEVQAKADRMNLDENAVGEYAIPPLPLDEQTTPKEFTDKIRPRLVADLSQYMYGPIPPVCEELQFILSSEGNAFGGLAQRREFDIVCRQGGFERILHLLLYIPKELRGKTPVFFGLNFRGNISTSNDPDATFHPFALSLAGNHRLHRQRVTKMARLSFFRGNSNVFCSKVRHCHKGLLCYLPDVRMALKTRHALYQRGDSGILRSAKRCHQRLGLGIQRAIDALLPRRVGLGKNHCAWTLASGQDPLLGRRK